MKRRRELGPGVLAGLLLAGLLALPGMAQHQTHHQTAKKDTTQSEPGVTAGKMHGSGHAMMRHDTRHDHMPAMHQMTSHPVMRTMMMTTAMRAMTDTLELSEGQVRRLDGLSESLRNGWKDLSVNIEEIDKTLRSELDTSSDVDPSMLASLVKKRMSMVGDLQALTLTYAMRMYGILSADQQAKLASMDPEQMHRRIMSQMSEMDAMMTMRSAMMMGMNCPIMTPMSGMSHEPSMSESN